LYDPGKIALLSVEGSRALVPVLDTAVVVVVVSANDELDPSGFLVLPTRDGLRCIFPSRILFCSTRKGDDPSKN
jgi:hypothetical protein